MRAEAATGVAASMAADTEALGESLEFARAASALERMEVELERSASRRPPVARPVARPVVVVQHGQTAVWAVP